MYATVPLLMYDRRVLAALSCGSTFSKIGKHLANIAIGKGCTQRSKVAEYNGRRRVVKVIVVPMGTRTGRIRPVECLIDAFTPPMGVILGLAGMKALGYRITVDRTVAEHHGPGESEAQQEVSAATVERAANPIIEEECVAEDFIMAMTEAEMREMENWERDL